MARRALLVAADRYEDPGYQQLRAPVAEVKALRAVLADPACGGFEVLTPLINRDEPTLRHELELFFDSADYDDLLLLYISGHGELRGGRLYFATATTSRRQLRATALVDSYVHDLMDHSPARSVVLVLDCCHSGAFGKGIPKSPPEIELAERFGGSGRMTMAASAQIEYAFEHESASVSATGRTLPGSAFTAALVDGLRRANANEDGDVTLDALYRFVCDEVRRRNPQQTPRLLGDRAGEIVMARRPGGPRPRLPQQLADHIESPLWYVRKGAAEELARLRMSRDPKLARAAEDALQSLSEDPDRRVVDAAQATLDSARRLGDSRATVTPSAPRATARETAYEVMRLGHDGAVSGVAFSPDGIRVATASSDSTARVWDSATGRELMRLPHDGIVFAVAFSPDDGRRVATASFDRVARVWDSATGRELVRLPHNSIVFGVAFSPDGARIATVGSGAHIATAGVGSLGGGLAARMATVWDSSSGLHLVRLLHNGNVRAVAFSPDGARIATASDDTARVWDSESGRELGRLGHGLVRAVAFSPDGTRIATAGGVTARVWDAASGRELTCVKHSKRVSGVAFSPDGARIATASDDMTLRLWDSESGTEFACLRHEDSVRWVAFSPDGTRIATANAGSREKTVIRKGFLGKLREDTVTEHYGYATVWRAL